MSGLTAIIGRGGEDVATEWLRERGYYIVERNWRVGHYEIDIIAQHYDTLHFIRRGAMAYRAMHHIRLELQFDLIAVTWNEEGDIAIDYTENIM